MSKCNIGRSVLEQAVISKNKDFLFRFLGMQDNAQKEMIEEISVEALTAFLGILSVFFKEKEMRYESIAMIKRILQWRKNAFKGLGVKISSSEGENKEYEEKVEALKQVLTTINEEKVDMNKICELKGRMEYIQEQIAAREVEKENVPICREK